MDIDEYREIINRFSFDRCKRGNQGYNRILIQLFGLLGNGKSSFINTCKYVWEDGEYRNWAKAYGTDGGLTTERIPYELTRNITMVDNRGYSQLNGHVNGEIFAQLANLLPLGKVTWNEGFTVVEKIVRAEKEIKTSDFIVPVFVHSVKRNTIPEEEKEDIKEIITKAMKVTGIYPIVVLTHKTSGKLSDTEATFRDMGVERVFAFENYTREDHHKTRGQHEEVLKFLHEVIKDVQFRVDEPRDPVREMTARKQIVMNYVHDKTKEMTLEEEEKKHAMLRVMMKKKEEEERKVREERARNERRMQEKELRMQKEDLEWQRQLDQDRHEEELKIEILKNQNKKKFLGIFPRK